MSENDNANALDQPAKEFVVAKGETAQSTDNNEPTGRNTEIAVHPRIVERLQNLPLPELQSETEFRDLLQNNINDLMAYSASEQLFAYRRTLQEFSDFWTDDMGHLLVESEMRTAAIHVFARRIDPWGIGSSEVMPKAYKLAEAVRLNACEYDDIELMEDGMGGFARQRKPYWRRQKSSSRRRSFGPV